LVAELVCFGIIAGRKNADRSSLEVGEGGEQRRFLIAVELTRSISLLEACDRSLKIVELLPNPGCRRFVASDQGRW
jgi:hypothetical protein